MESVISAADCDTDSEAWGNLAGACVEFVDEQEWQSQVVKKAQVAHG